MAHQRNGTGAPHPDRSPNGLESGHQADGGFDESCTIVSLDRYTGIHAGATSGVNEARQIDLKAALLRKTGRLKCER